MGGALGTLEGAALGALAAAGFPGVVGALRADFLPAVGGGPLGGAPGRPPVGGGPLGGPPTREVF